MKDLCRLIWWAVAGRVRSRAALEAENLVLRQQTNVLRRTALRRHSFNCLDRLVFVWLYRVVPDVRGALAIVKPDTVIRWHRSGFKAYWRWKSRSRGGRPKVALEVRRLIHEMSVAKYMARRRRPPSQGWKTFLRNHADGIAAMRAWRRARRERTEWLGD
jgi:hypothetical protein